MRKSSTPEVVWRKPHPFPISKTFLTHVDDLFEIEREDPVWNVSLIHCKEIEIPKGGKLLVNSTWHFGFMSLADFNLCYRVRAAVVSFSVLFGFIILEILLVIMFRVLPALNWQFVNFSSKIGKFFEIEVNFVKFDEGWQDLVKSWAPCIGC